MVKWELKDKTFIYFNSGAISSAKHFIFIFFLFCFKILELTVLKFPIDPGERSADALSKHSPRMEKHTWAWRCGSHVRRELNPGLIFPNTNSLDGLSLLFFACLSYLLFSWQVSLYPKPMWWAHIPKGSFAQFHILCNTHRLQMNSKEFWQEKEIFCLMEEKEVVVGYFRDSWGFVGIPYSFVISSSWELGDIWGESWVLGGVE